MPAPSSAPLPPGAPASAPSVRRRTGRPALLLSLLFVVLAAWRALGAQQVPAALVPPSPAPTSYIHDGGPVLDAAARDTLDRRIAAVRAATGGDVAVAIVRDLGGRAPAEVGVAIYRAWGVGRVDSLGSARRDLGALLLIVPKELAPDGRGECWITTGLGAEGTLLDARAGAICGDSVVPRLRARAYAAAIAAGIGGIGAAFAEATTGAPAMGAPARERGSDGGGALGAALLGAGLLGGGAGAVAWARRVRRRRPRPCPAGHGPMTRLDEASDDAALTSGQRAEERVGSIDYDVWACAVCAERTIVPYRRWSSHAACPACGARTVTTRTRTLVPATTAAPGLAEVTATCAHCAWQDVTRRVLPRISTSSGGSGGGGGGGGGGSSRSFGGSGRTSGGGGGRSY
jgi:uncharacterized protein